MTQISGGGAPSFRIGPTGPTNYARFANNSTPTWGSALSRIGGAWAAKHNKEQIKAANRALASEQAVKRAGWAQKLGQGATLRDLVTIDPTVLADKDFISFWDKSRPAKQFEDVTDAEGNILGQRGPDNRWYEDPRAAPDVEEEVWEDVQSPFGRGGFGQRSNLSNKVIGYQGPVAAATAPHRRTATDRSGRLRYLDTGEAAFSDEVLGQGRPPEADAPPLKDRLQMVRQLSDDWQKTVRPMQGLLDQSDRMNIGLKMAQDGDMLAGSQAILISFNKLLDPTSVVRESEYARSATGQSALETLKGYADRLARGGAGVTISELESYKRVGEEVVKRALESRVGPERKRISRLVEYAGVDPELIFTGRFAPEPPPQGAPQGHPQVAPARPPAQEDPPPQGRAPTPSAFSKLVTALTGGPAPAPARAPAGPGPAPASSLPQQRVRDYAALPPAALRRQVDQMAEKLAADPKAYSQAEVNAAKRAFDAAFPGER